MRRPEITGFVSIAPPASMYDFAFLAPCPASGLIVHGTKDNVVPEADVQKLVDRLTAQKALRSPMTRWKAPTISSTSAKPNGGDGAGVCLQYVSKPREGR